MKLPSQVSVPRAEVTPLLVITGIVWVSAVLASMSALYGLAAAYGGWQPVLAGLFPCCLDLYWIAALGVALDTGLTAARRRAAAAHSLVAFLLSAAGQLLYHELRAGEIQLGHLAWAVVAVIGVTPAIAGAALAHLIALSSVTVLAKPKRRAAAAVPAAPARAGTVPVTAPDRAMPAAPGSPRPLRPGVRPDAAVIQAARDIWYAAIQSGQIHNDRSLEKAVNDHFGCKAIGRTSAATVIAAETGARRRAV